MNAGWLPHRRPRSQTVFARRLRLLRNAGVLVGLAFLANACAPSNNAATPKVVTTPTPTPSSTTVSPAPASTSPAPTAPAATAPAPVPVPVPAATSVAAAGGAQLVVVNGPGWTSSGLAGPSYATEHCTYRHVASSGVDQPLPDPSCTPGAIDSAVTQSNLDQTICRSGGYTSSVRPPESITEPAKSESMTAYGATGSVSGYEYDHLVPLGLGGASDTANLWPEPNTGSRSAYIHNTKDQIEADLHSSVCAGTTPLAAAQAAIASNWTTATSAA